MSNSSKKRPVWATLTMLAITCSIIWAIFNFFILSDKPIAPPLDLYVGDPISACAFPAADFNPKTLDYLYQVDGVMPLAFDEFPSWKLAKQAGYMECH